MVQKSQLITSIIINGGNTFFLLYYIYDSYVHPIDLLHITRWSFFLNSIFTTICLICDIIIYHIEKEETSIDMNYNLMIDKDINKKEKNLMSRIKTLDDFNKNKYGIVCNTFCYFVSLGFLFLFFFENDIMQVSKSIKNLFNCIYHHFIIQIIIIINVFISERKKHFFSWFYLNIIFAVYILYIIIICFEKYFLGINAYFFMRDKTNLFLFFCFIFSSLFLFLCYLLNMYIINFRSNKNKDTLFD
jgi:hypothetical protein